MARRARRKGQASQGCAVLRLRRGALLGTTALQAGFALAFALPAAAQPAPSAGPQGGAVVAGQASIARQGNATTITQSTDRAAIDWRTFDVGRDHTVRFQQPGAGSMTLNRVTTPRPSEIAGRIQANGGVVIINGAGVLFHRGAQVEAQSFIASTADTTNAAFMAGRLQFDRPGRPGARIENRGEITVREAGLAALVAPGVANSGTIRARLGTVVLAGAETHTLDLHGDGLVAFDVTGQVRTAPTGADGQPVQALVTNTGVVVAEGGTVLMTARAADGVVQQLVSAGGSIRADSVGERTGSIEIAGVGGGIRVHGTVAADGTRPAERGGTVVARATGDVQVASTARISASGAAGGGTVAVGTTAARARAQGGGIPADAARRVDVAAGAEIRADASQAGTGGRIAFIGRQAVAMAGKVAARGGEKGGDGGRVEVSAERSISLVGSVETMAPLGAAGTLLIDPLNLTIGGGADSIAPGGPPVQVPAGLDAADDATLTVATVVSLLGSNNVRLEAINDLTVSEAISFTTNSNALTLAAGNNVVVNQAISLKGDVALLASDPAITGATASGQVQVNAPVSSLEGSVLMWAAGSDGAVVFAPLASSDAATTLTLVANSITLPTATIAVTAPLVELSPNAGWALSFGAGAATGLTLPDLSSITAGTIRLGGATLPGSGLTTLASATSLAGNIDLAGMNLDLRATGAVARSGGTLSGVAALTGSAGTGFAMDGAYHQVTTLGAIASTGGRVSLKLAGDRTLSTLPTAPGGFHIEAEGDLLAPSAIAIAGEIALTGAKVSTSATLQSTGGAVVLTGTGAGVDLGAAVTAATRIGIRADVFDRNGHALTTGGGGVVEIARHSAGQQVVSDFGGLSTGALRLGAVTAPGAGSSSTVATSLKLAASPGPAPGFNTLDLRTSGAVTQSVALNLSTVTLRGTAGSISLDNPANAIATLGPLKATTGDLLIATGGDLAATAAITANGSATLRTNGTLTVQAAASVTADAITLKAGAGGIVLDGDLDAGGTLQLGSTGAVSGAGAVSAGTLTGAVGSLDLGGTTPAAIGAIGSFSSQGAFSLVAAGPVAVTGTLQAAQVNSGALNLSLASGALTVSGGIATGNGGAAGGDITLVAPGGVTLQGGVQARAGFGAFGDIAITAASGQIGQTTGSVTAARNLTLSAATGIAQTGGALDAQRLDATVSEAGAAVDLGRANRLDMLGALTAPGGISVNNSFALGIVGPVRAGQAPVGAAQPGAPADLRITAAGALSVAGELTAGQAAGGGAPAVAGRIVLQSNDGTTRGGATSAAAVDIAPGASLAARRSGGSGGTMALTAESALPGGGVVSVRTPVSALTAGGITVTANSVAVGGGFFGNGALLAPSGRITLNTEALSLEGFPPGGLNLSAAGGTVAIAPRSAGVAVSLGGAGPGLALGSATLARIGADVLQLGRADGGTVTVVGSAALGTVATLAVLSGGDLAAQAGGVLQVNRLTADVGGSIRLESPGGPHQIGTLADLTAGGAIAYRGQGSVIVDGAVQAGTDVLLATGAGGTLSVQGGAAVTAGSGGTVTLQGDDVALAGPVTAPGGRIEILPVTSGTQITLAGAGGLSLLQSDLGLLSAETLLLGARQGGVPVAGNLLVAGLADLTGRANRLQLGLQGVAFDAGAGSGIVVARLGEATPGTGLNVGGLVLLGDGNRIGAVDAFRSGGTFALSSAVPLAMAGPVEAAGAILVTGTASGMGLTVTGSLASGTLGGAASGSAGPLTLETTQGGLTLASGAAVQARNGALLVRGATSGAGGATTIAAGATVTTAQDATIRGDAGLVIAGTVIAGTGVQLRATEGSTAPALSLTDTGSVTTSAGDIGVTVTGSGAAVLDGSVIAPGRLVLTGGSVSGTGSVQVAAVTGSARSLALTGTANRIGALEALTTTVGGITLNDLDALTIAGMVQSAGPATLSAPSLTIPLGAVLAAPGETIRITAADFIHADGQVIAGTLIGGAASGNALFGNGANAVDVVGDFAAGGSFVYRGATTLLVSGDVAAPGGVTIGTTAAGPDALRLTGSVTASAGAVELDAGAGGMRLLGDVTAGGSVTLLAATLVQESGSVIGGSVQATAAGAATQASGATLRASGTDLWFTAGSFDLAGTLEAARDVVLTATAGNGMISGALTAGQDAVLSVAGGTLALSGTSQATRDVSATADGDVSVTGSVTAETGALSLVSTAGALSLAADVTAAGAVTLQAFGALDQSSGSVEGASVQATAGGAATQTAGATLRATGSDLGVQAASFDLAGTLDAARDVALTAIAGNGVVSGALTAGQDAMLSVSGGTLALSGSVQVVRDMNATSSGDLAVTGSVTADTGALSLVSTAGALSLAADVTAAGAVTLSAFGAIDQSSGTVEGASVQATAGGAATQASGATLRATGTDLGVQAARFDLAGTLDAARDVALAATAGNGVVSGALTAGQDAVLSVTGGTLAVAGPVQATRDVRAGSSGNLAVTGRVTADTGVASLISTAGALSLAADVTAAGAVTLQAFGALDQTAGMIAGASVQTMAGGAATQAAGATLRATSTDLGVQAASFDLAGTLDAARDVALTATAGNGVVSGSLTAGQDAVLSVTGGTLALSGSVRSTRDVNATSSGDLTVTGNVTADTGTLGLVSTAGALSLAADVNAAGGVTLQAATTFNQTKGIVQASSIALISNDIVTMSGSVLSAVGALSFNAAGDIEAQGLIETAKLTGAAGGSALLSGGNRVVALGSFTAGNNFTLNNSLELKVSDRVTAGNELVLGLRGALVLDAPGAPFALDAPTLRVESAGVLQRFGAVRTGLLDLTSGSDVTLDLPTNQIAALRAAVTTDLTLRTDSNLTIQAVVSAVGSASITATGDVLIPTGSTLEADVQMVLTGAQILTAGDLTAPSLSLTATAGDIEQSGGTIRWNSGTATLNANADIRQTGGRLVSNMLGTLTGNAGGSVRLTQAANNFSLFGPFAAANGLAVTHEFLMNVFGPLDAGAGALTLEAGSQIVAQFVSLAGASASLRAGSGVTIGSIADLTVTGALLISAPGFTTLDGTISAGSATLSLGSLLQQGSGVIAIDGPLSLTASGNALLSGQTSASDASIAVGSLTQSAGSAIRTSGLLTIDSLDSLTLNGIVTSGGTAALRAGGAFVQQAGARLDASGPLNLVAGTDITLDGVVLGDLIGLQAGRDMAQAAGGSLATPGAVQINAAGNAVLDGSVTGATIAIGTGLATSQQAGGSLVATGPLTVTAGTDITLDGIVSGNPIRLQAGRDIAQAAGGSLTTPADLQINAAGNAALDGNVGAASIEISTGLATSQQASGSLVASGPLTITAGTDITLDGVVSGNPILLRSGRDIAQAASGRLSTSTLTLAAGGNASFAGTILAELLTGTVGGALLADGTANRIALLRDFAAGQSLILDNDTALQVEGSIAAPSIIVTTTGPLSLGNVALSTSGVPYVEPPPGPIVETRLPDPIPFTPGAVFETGANTLDVGTLTVTPQGTENATLALRLPASGGTLRLEGELNAPTTDVTFDLGTGGRVTGRIDVRNLRVLGLGGSADLEGRVRGFDGSAAASVSVIGPQLEPEYQINNCPVGSVNCVLLIVQLPVVTDPLKELGVSTTRDDRDDPDIYVPNVAERDF
ncbi:filamentous hemagglutinin N-terminal domain-containing protein [Roseomonas sp. AR75]|uniref:beta strand repeat-containing protein n=1 Tax=Roseomonas sp. AR75 TaxID=2562311 RepID=UPI0010C0ABEF|nr:filamentous hemagglutinin N-terminal domain-containing protein [Roseomonas sp. AR75]